MRCSRDRRRSPPRRSGCRPARPSAMTRPALSTVMRSATFITSRMLCSTSSTVMPEARMRRMSSPSSATSAGFMPAAGSSSRRSRGPLASARAISSRRWSTSVSSDGRSCARISMPTKLEQCSAALARAARSARRSKKPSRSSVLQRIAAGRASGADGDVLDHGEPREQPHLLEVAGDAHGQHLVRPLGRYSSRAVEQHASAGRRNEPADDVEQRGLAGAIRADQGMDAPVRDLARHVVERQVAAEPLD